MKSLNMHKSRSTCPQTYFYILTNYLIYIYILRLAEAMCTNLLSAFICDRAL